MVLGKTHSQEKTNRRIFIKIKWVSSISIGSCYSKQRTNYIIDNGYWLVIIVNFYCINMVFCNWLSFDYFDVSISIYLWCHLLMLVVGTASLTLVDGTKKTGLVSCSGIYIFINSSGDLVCLIVAILYLTMLDINRWHLSYK